MAHRLVIASTRPIPSIIEEMMLALDDDTTMGELEAALVMREAEDAGIVPEPADLFELMF
jgi:hypothetical protein